MHKRAICCIPSGEMILSRPIQHWLKRFADYTRRSATEIVLPAVGVSGPLYDSQVHPFPAKYKRSELLNSWVNESRTLLGANGTVWGWVLVDGQFLDNNALWQRNQYDQEFSQLCITNPVAQSVLQDLIAEILNLGVDGVVLDLTDAYPNTGSTGFKGVSAHCFCDFCVDQLQLKDFRESKDSFVGEEGLLRLVLRIDDDGAAHIDPPQEWIDQRNRASLVNVSLARKFVQGDRAALEQDATRLLDYFRARVATTAESVRTVLSIAKKHNARSAVILGSIAADLSQMVTLQALYTAASADEFWVPDAPDRRRIPGDWQAVQFLAGRSTYTFNAFFSLVEGARQSIFIAGVEGFLQRLLSTSQRLMSNKLAQGAAYTVDKLEQYSGFVGVPLGEEDHLEIVQRLAREATGAFFPTEVIDRFRVPDKHLGLHGYDDR